MGVAARGQDLLQKWRNVKLVYSVIIITSISLINKKTLERWSLPDGATSCTSSTCLASSCIGWPSTCFGVETWKVTINTPFAMKYF